MTKVRDNVKNKPLAYKAFFENSPDLCYMISPEGIILDCNKRVLEVLGYKKNELIGKPLLTTIYPPEHQKKVKGLLNKWKKEGKIQAEELVIKTKTGKLIDVVLDTAVARDDEDNIQYSISIQRIITDQKRVKEEIIKERFRAQKYLDVANVIMIVIDRNRKVSMINKKGCQVLGCKEDDIVGKNWIENFVPTEHRKDVENCFNELIAGNLEPFQYFKNPVLTKHGEQRTIAWHNAILTDKDGTVKATLSSGEDITDQEEAIKELRNSEERLKILFEYAPDAYFLLDLEGTLLDGNKAGEKLIGYYRDELDNPNIFELGILSEKDGLKLAKMLSKSALGKPTGPDEFTIYRKDKTKVEIETRTFPIEIDSQHLILGIARDITLRKEAEKMILESEEKFRAISSVARDAIILINGTGEVVFWNHAAEKMFGYSSSEIIGKELHAIIAADINLNSYRTKMDHFKKTGNGHVIGKTLELEAEKRDGTLFPVELTVSPVKLKDSWFAIGIVRDIAARKSYEKALKAAKERAELLFRVTPSAIFTVDRNHRITSWNKKAEELTGYSSDEIVGTTCNEFALGPCDKSCRLFTENIDKPLTASECTIKRKDGKTRIISKNSDLLRDENNEIIGGIESFEDITEKKEQEERLAYLAGHDPLTGLPNRRSLESALERATARARRGTISTLLFIDLDNFKQVNDTLGHKIGDEVLITLTKLLKKELRTEDILARIGGDEFAILLEMTDIDKAQHIAERLRQSVAQHDFTLSRRKYDLSISIGIARIDGKYEPGVSMSRADKAMYKAKEKGRNRAVLYQL